MTAYTLPSFELSFRGIKPGVVRLYQRYTVPKTVKLTQPTGDLAYRFSLFATAPTCRAFRRRRLPAPASAARTSTPRNYAAW